MATHGDRFEWVSHFLHKNLLWLLLGSYAVAAAWPGPGLKARSISVGEVALFHEQLNLSLPVLMLAALLLNAGLGVRVDQLRGLARRPAALLAGLVANLLIPVAYILGVSLVMGAWHNPDEVQNILVGLAMVASMPIMTPSATGLEQNADGDLAAGPGSGARLHAAQPRDDPAGAARRGHPLARRRLCRGPDDLAAGGARGVPGRGSDLAIALGIAIRSMV